MKSLPASSHPDLLVGFGTADDAGVFRISETEALVQTLDFFTPIVDDPYWFGKIAAANSLSDVYAMGGRPITAMNIVCFPQNDMPLEILSEILRGAGDIVRESGAVTVGGHSVKDKELKFGLSVTGIVDPNKIITNAGAKAGDRLYLSKPLGTGILSTAIKRDLAEADVIDRLTRQLATLNNIASDVAVECGAHAITDISGFGFLGHAVEMARGSGVTLKINSSALPVIPEALEFASKGCITGAEGDNMTYVGDDIEMANGIDRNLAHILWDPQTSGGLLVAVPAENAKRFEQRANEMDLTAPHVGEVVELSGVKIKVL